MEYFPVMIRSRIAGHDSLIIFSLRNACGEQIVDLVHIVLVTAGAHPMTSLLVPEPEGRSSAGGSAPLGAILRSCKMRGVGKPRR